MKRIKFDVIGRIETPFNSDEELEINTCFQKESSGCCNFTRRNCRLLNQLRGYKHAVLIYNKRCKSFTENFDDILEQRRNKSVFYERKPKCSNQIGFAIVRISRIHEGKLFFTPADILNNAELIDVKPFVKAGQKDHKLKSILI